jgi:hypothetical protein
MKSNLRLRQGVDQLLWLPRIRSNLGAYRGQRIEQQLRLDLHLQHRQSHLHGELLLRS